MRHTNKIIKALAIVLFFVVAICGCRKEETIVPPVYGPLGFQTDPDADPIGMYVLNEGNMGSNKADIDFLDYREASYACGIYAKRIRRLSKDWETPATISKSMTEGCSPSSTVRTRWR